MILESSVYLKVRNYFYLLGVFGLTLGLIGGVKAEEDAKKPIDPAVEKAVNELIQTYTKLEGYLATYACISGEKSAKCIIATDFESHQQSLNIEGKGGAENLNMRYWMDDKDNFFVVDGKDFYVFRGINKQFDGIAQIANLMGVDRSKTNLRMLPNFMLDETGIIAGINWSSSQKPSWVEYMTDASIQSSDVETVTFKTPNRGLLTIQRKSGVLIKQSLSKDGKTARTIEITDLKLNPGKDAVGKISADWPTPGAKEQPAITWMAPIWNQLFQVIIENSDKGKFKVDQLDMVLNQQYEVLRDLSKACIEQTPSAISAKINWTQLLAKVKASARESWRKDNPRFEEDEEKAFLEIFNSPAFRLKIRDTIIELFMQTENLPPNVMDEIFGAGYWVSLKAKTDNGLTAKKLISKAIARAYFEALIDQKMTSHWDQDDNID